MEREARAGEPLDRRVVAPVEREEAAGLAGRRAGDPGALDHGDPDAAAGQEVGDRGAHDAGAADDDVSGRGHGRLAGQGSTIPGHGPRRRDVPDRVLDRARRARARRSRSAASSRCGSPSTPTSRPAARVPGRAARELPREYWSAYDPFVALMAAAAADQAAQARHRHLPRDRARPDRDREGDRDARPPVRRARALRHRRRLERGGDGEPRHRVEDAAGGCCASGCWP